MAEGGGKGALRELVAYLGFNLDKKPLEEADKGVESLKKKSETLTRALETVGLALGVREIGEFISGQIEMGAQIEHTSAQLGVSADELQRFQYAAETTGISADDASNALGFLARSMGAAGQGQEETVKIFQQFHVALKDANGQARPLSDVMGDLAEGFSKTSDTGKKTYAAMTLFGRSGRQLIPLLSKGREGVAGLSDEFDKLGGGLSEDFIASSEEAEHGMVMLHTATRGLWSEIGSALLPTVAGLAGDLAGLVARFREWERHTHLIRNALITLAAIAGILVITWGILNIEILLVVAALALLALAVDDVITFFEDGDSVLGRFLDKLYGVGESKHIAQELRDAWKEVSDAFGKLWDAVKNLGPDLKALFDTFTKQSDGSNAKSVIQGIADAMKGLVDWVTKATTELDSLLKKFDDFAKAHPLLVHAVQRSAHQVGQGNVGIGGALKAIGGDAIEAFGGDKSINSYDEAGKGKVSAPGQFHIPLDHPMYIPPTGITAPNMNQHNETHIQLYGVAGGQDAALRVGAAVKDAHTEANNAAFPAVGGGGAP